MSYETVKSYYNRVWAAIQNKQLDLAEDILFKQMPVSLYDMSMDICYNYNPEFSDEELRQLIRKVDKVINKDINDDIDDLNPIDDSLNDPKTALF